MVPRLCITKFLCLHDLTFANIIVESVESITKHFRNLGLLFLKRTFAFHTDNDLF